MQLTRQQSVVSTDASSYPVAQSGAFEGRATRSPDRARLGRSAKLRTLTAYIELAKPRILTLVLAAAAAGFCLAAPGPVALIPLVHTLLATALVAAGANALNQLLERETDARMHRTASRPLPTGRLEPSDALRFGVFCGSAGVLYLALALNALAAFVAAATLAGYIFVYTPLKMRTHLATLVGAVPGALPPLIGWAAASGTLNRASAAVFIILFLWQLPHFLAIAWIYRDDYARADMPLLTRVDANGAAAARQMVLYSAALLPASLLPTALGLSGTVYFGAALLLSVAYLAFSVWMAATMSLASARGLFRFSILHLLLLLGVMTIDKVPY